MMDDSDFIKRLQAQASETTQSISEKQKKLDMMAAEAAAETQTIGIQKRFLKETEELRMIATDHSDKLQSLQIQKSTVIERINKEETMLVRALGKGETLVYKRREAQKEFDRAQDPDIDAYVESAITDESMDVHTHLVTKGIVPKHMRRNALWGQMTRRKRTHDPSDRIKERHIARYNAFSEDRRKILGPYELENKELSGQIDTINAEGKILPTKANRSLRQYMKSMDVLNPKKPEEHINIFKESQLTEKTLQDETQVKDRTMVEVLEEDLDMIIGQHQVIRPIRVNGTALSLHVLNVRKYLQEIRKIMNDIDPSNIDVEMMEEHLKPLFEKVHPTDKVKVGKYDPDLNERIRKTAEYSDEQFRQYTEMIIADPMEDQNLVIDTAHFDEMAVVYNLMLPTFDKEESVDMKYAMLRRPMHMINQIKVMLVNHKEEYKQDMIDLLKTKIMLLGSEEYAKRIDDIEELSRMYIQRFVPKHMKERQESQAQMMEKIAQRVYDQKQAEQQSALPATQEQLPLDKYKHRDVLNPVDKPELPPLEPVLSVISGGKAS